MTHEHADSGCWSSSLAGQLGKRQGNGRCLCSRRLGRRRARLKQGAALRIGQLLAQFIICLPRPGCIRTLKLNKRF